MSFHENKLWQDAYVALMDVHSALSGDFDGSEKDIVEDTLESATKLSAKIADGLSRLDRRFGIQIIKDAIGLVAVVRTHLAVAWGQGIITDEVFKDLDTKYDMLSLSLQKVR